MPYYLGARSLILLFFITAFFGVTAHAQKRKFLGFSFKAPPSAYKSNNKVFTTGFAVLGGQGKMGNGLDDAPDRDLYFMPVQFFMGLRLGKFRLCAAGEYMQASQITDALEVANTNLSGTGIAYGPRLDYYDGKQSFGVFYRAKDSYKLEKPDINENSHEYTASGGYTIQYTRRLIGRLGVVLDYSQEEFTESLDTKNVKWNRTAIGLIISNFDLK